MTAEMKRTKILKEDGRLLRGEATRERVLDAAERLFAEMGYDAISIRDIAEAAEVTLGVVGFHGGTKLQLFETVLARRVATLSAGRQERLAELCADPNRLPTVEMLIRAYMQPYMRMAYSGDPQWRAYTRLMARSVQEERWYPTLHDLYDPDAHAYLTVLARVLPHADPQRLAAAFVMSVGAMLSTVTSAARMQALAGLDGTGAVPVDFTDILVAFCVGGLERAATGP